ncbi:transposase [Wolbachia endosymbiont of Armadillidium vulgare str. wVulC]|nr:transposase [Wolbachia endosymbiont of Armadillidium vulgare str. wVulC]OJH30640.1 Transposase [Armadillidium vulgare] [Wolbachia endosymbiont of Armadillidium vulgare]
MREEVVAKRFKIGKTTLYEWQIRRKETGVEKTGEWSTKLLTGMRLLNLLKSTVEKLYQKWLNCLGNISCQTISGALKKVNFTRKKTYGYKERSEENRAKFTKIIEIKEPENLVYIDESGHRRLCLSRKDSGFML